MPSSTTISGDAHCLNQQILDAERAAGSHVGDHALVHGAARLAIEIVRLHAPHRHACSSASSRAALTRSPARGDTRIAVTRPARSASRTGLMP